MRAKAPHLSDDRHCKTCLTYCQQDQSIDALIVQETDRLARNTIDHLTIKAHLKENGIDVISVNQPMLDDSPEGKMMDTVLAGVNQFYSDLNGRKTKKGMQEKFDRGWFPGQAPLGYINVPVVENAENERKVRSIINPDPKKWHFIKKVFEMYLTGEYSVMEINDLLYKEGLRSVTGKKVPKSVMCKVLKNPFYAGLMRWSGQEKMGNHKPLIMMTEYNRVQQIIDAHNLHACRRRKHNFLLRGFLICNQCGCRYTAEKHPKKKKSYYHCTSMRNRHSNKGQMIEISDLEDMVGEQFRSALPATGI